MRRPTTVAFALFFSAFVLTHAALAADLAAIERKIAKLPELSSEQPLYCLLVFGPQADTRIWLVRDGDVLYVDRNANGDLSEAGERVEITAGSRPEEGVLGFKVGDIVDGELVHKDLNVSWFNVDHLKGSDTRVTARLKRDPNFRAVAIACDVAMPAFHGSGIEGRVSHMALLGDLGGLLDFAPRPEDAPILHFGGPRQITLYGPATLRIGRRDDLILVVGTPGVGPGSTVSMAYDQVIPPDVRPRVDVTVPTADGSSLARSYSFDRRCCQVNLYDAVALPEGTAPGQATVNISLDGWSRGEVAPSVHQLAVLPALPGPKLLPVSPRLTSRLEHMHPDAGVCSIRFSPDGTRLIAGDYPGGVIHIWQLATGKRLVTIDTGEGYRSAIDYFHISPDWQRIYTSTHERGRFNRVQRDGQTRMQATYTGAVHIWDANTGERLHTWQQDPPRGNILMTLTPDGRQLFVLEETPGEFTSSRPRAMSVLDTQSLAARQLADRSVFVAAVSADSRLAAASLPPGDNPNYSEAIAFFRLPEWQEAGRIPLGELQNAHVAILTPDGKIAIGTVTTLPKRDDWRHATHAIKFWDVATGQELHTVEAASPNEQFTLPTLSPDGSIVAASGIDQQNGHSRMLLVDLHDWTTREIPRENRSFIRGFAFHPAGRWLAVSETKLPKQISPSTSATSLEQPRIHLVETATGNVLETMIAPQSFQMSIAISPDGNTLATAGEGAVLLWDMTTPPGQLPGQPKLGQQVELAGTTVDGQPLRADAYHGKLTLLSFWATWCQPCVAEMPELKSIYEDLHEQGFEVIGFSLDDADVDLAAFAAKQALPWTVLHGNLEGTAASPPSLAKALGVTSVPRSFLLDGEAKIIAIDPPLHELKALVEKSLAK